MQLDEQTAADDEGFTLIELVVTVGIMSIIMTALVGMVILYMKITNQTQTKLTESSDQQFASAYWQQDVSSLGVRGTPPGDGSKPPTSQSVWTYSTPSPADASLPGSCAGHSNTIAAFAWNDYQNVPSGDPTAAWNATSNASVYYTKAVVTNGASQLQLWRIRCGGVTSDTELARFLDPSNPPSVSCQDKDGAATSCSGSNPFPATISLTITVRDLGLSVQSPTGYTTVLTAERRQG